MSGVPTPVPTRAASSGTASGPLLEVTDLSTHFHTRRGVVRAVDGVSFSLDRGRSLCIVGESGSGKSMTAKSIMQLLPTESSIVAGSIRFGGSELVGAGQRELRSIRGSRMAMLFQDPMTSLNPLMTIGAQITETIRARMQRTRRWRCSRR
jgi:ABC-type dipeptide/oligopeptide/nickel transport system ATPase component